FLIAGKLKLFGQPASFLRAIGFALEMLKDFVFDLLGHFSARMAVKGEKDSAENATMEDAGEGESLFGLHRALKASDEFGMFRRGDSFLNELKHSGELAFQQACCIKPEPWENLALEPTLLVLPMPR